MQVYLNEKILARALIAVCFIGIVASIWFTYDTYSDYVRPTSLDDSPASFADIIESTPEPTPEITYDQPGIRAELPAATWVPQSFNNCGPAATSMILQYFGYNISQVQTKQALRHSDADSNVFTYEIANYLKQNYQIENKVLYNGDYETIKTLIANDIYVLVEIWLHPYEDIGHFAILRGFDDQERVFIGDDSYISVGTQYPYDIFDAGQWKSFNRQYTPLYRADQEEIVKAIVGESWDEDTMHRQAIQRNLADVQTNEADMYAWFNLGKSYFALEQYQQASEAFRRSRSIGWPGRMLWYHTEPAEVENILGNHTLALELANTGLANNQTFAEMLHQAGLAQIGIGNQAAARTLFQNSLNYGYQPSQNLLNQLSQ